MISKLFGLLLIGATFSPFLTQSVSAEPKPDCPEIQGNYLVRVRVSSMPVCQAEYAIAANGSYAFRHINGQISRGLISSRDLSLLKRRISQANFAQMKSKPFTGTCPIVYDGAEFIYTFRTAKGTETLASCKFALDGKNPLLQQLTRLTRKIQSDNTYD